MINQVLYRKYRPKTFEEIEGQEHVVRTLRGALLSGRVGHAYLFCGPRGTGKTTMARLLAKALNCFYRLQVTGYRLQEKEHGLKPDTWHLKPDSVEPCNSCHSCTEINAGRSLDLIEIDAASNRGIDEIRNLKESAQVAATGGGYKIFIVDECHMLTREANNALLKLLEEPSSHVVFVLATTEPHKVPDTVLSRVQRFDFKKISGEAIAKKLREIAKQEKLQIDDDALTVIASSASGSLRDAESSLNKLIAYSGPLRQSSSEASAKITNEHVTEALGIVSYHIHQKLLELIKQKNGQEAIAQVAYLYENGVDMDNFVKQFVKYLRTKLIGLLSQTIAASSAQSEPSQTRIEPEFLIKVINLFIKAGSELKFSPMPQLPVELAILELTK
ncbi:MAG: DNA polymerase III subunit gamma/tau [Candidatus Yanofskybacteria bacterium]|nr:DNA polymerase III subunit gamma/tau [Candidatus Yanofskybacteria bacterium]